MPIRLTRRFFRRDPVTLARDLLGTTLVRILDDGTRLAGRIVEVEAYLGVKDRACHSYAGRRTPRNESMYLDAGTAYVYFTYGMHWCMNIVADRPGVPTACLIRALEPLEGIEVMQRLRGRERLTDLCSGPAKLTKSLAIDRSLDGSDLTTSPSLFIERGRPTGGPTIARDARIGIGNAGAWTDKRLRFFLRENPHVSLQRRANTGR